MINISKNWRLYLLLLLAQFCFATEVYKWTDAHGQLHYSDTKHDHATAFKLIQNDSFYKVKKVYDGDTILLNDGRKIRLLSINTPEVERPRQATQAGGKEAQQWLRQQLLNTQVRLEFDEQRRDKYKRYLAHVFTQQGMHINLELVRLAYASTSIHPPAKKYLAQLHAAQQIAETKRLGIWQYSEYAPKLTSEINANNKQGWQRIIGRVLQIKNTPKSRYLKMTDHFNVRVKKEHMHYFDNLVTLIGKKIEVRGWVNKYKNGYSMLIRHPTDIKVLD